MNPQVVSDLLWDIYSYDQQFCSFVGGALQQNHNFTEHAQEATAKFSMQWHLPDVPPKRQFFFVPEIILWRLAPMQEC